MLFCIVRQCSIRSVPCGFLSQKTKALCTLYPRLTQECASPPYQNQKYHAPVSAFSLPGLRSVHHRVRASMPVLGTNLYELCDSRHSRRTLCIVPGCADITCGVHFQTNRHFHEDNESDSSKHAKSKTGVHRATKQIQRTKDVAKEVRELVKRENIVTVPNMLTGLRIAMTPLLGYLVLQQAYAMACIIFIITGITDVLDGWIARTFANQTSAFGSFLDPLADKFLISVLFVTLTMVNLIPWPLTALVIARDICLITGAFYVRYISITPPKTLKKYFDLRKATAQLQPTAVSKFNTGVQLLLVTCSLCAPVFSYTDHPAMHALWFVTAASTIASGMSYVYAKNTFKLLQQTKKK